MITKKPAAAGKVRVTFAMPAAIWADTIHLVGDFNNWSTSATPLQQDDECWSVSLELEAGREYQYRYLINGVDWYNDWQADRYAPNEHGGDNSVVVTVPVDDFMYDYNVTYHQHTFPVEVATLFEEPLSDSPGDDPFAPTLPLDQPLFVELGGAMTYRYFTASSAMNAN